MTKSNNNQTADEIYNRKMQEKFGEVVNISVQIPKSILEEFTERAVSDGHANINSALINLMKSASKSKKNKKIGVQNSSIT